MAEVTSKAHWNYRVVRKTGLHEGAPIEWFAIHEVYYGDAGEPTNMSEEPVTFGGDSPEEVASALEMALNDARNRPVFDPPAGWPEPKGKS